MHPGIVKPGRNRFYERNQEEFSMYYEIIEYVDIALRAVLSVIVLFIMTKILGKKQITQLSMFDYIVGISIGSIAASMAVDRETEYIHGIIAIIIYSLLALLISYITMKSIKLRKFFNGAPTILVKHGKILETSLKKVKFEMNDFLMECRIAGYFDVSEIDYAVMETNGEISFMPVWNKKPVMAEDLAVPPQPQGLCSNVIIDGNIMRNNLNLVCKNEEWLLKQLKNQKIDKAEEVLLGTVDVNGKFTAYLKNEQDTTNNMLE